MKGGHSRVLLFIPIRWDPVLRLPSSVIALLFSTLIESPLLLPSAFSVPTPFAQYKTTLQLRATQPEEYSSPPSPPSGFIIEPILRGQTGN